MEHGFSFIGFSCDRYASPEMLQQVRRRGIAAHLVSVDDDTAPYEELKSSLYEKRIELYHYEPLVHELKKLEYDRLVGKIDHPDHESKDVADAVCGACWGLHGSATKMSMSGLKEETQMKPHKHAWVSPLIPSDEIDPDEIRDIKEGSSASDFMPIMFGDDDGGGGW
jgi:hypothetical protein